MLQFRFTSVACSLNHSWYRNAKNTPYSMQHSPSWEANQFSASQEIPRILCNPKVHTAFTSARHLSLSWATSIQPMPPTSHFLKIHLNIFLPSTSGSSKWPLSLRFPHQNSVYTSALPHTCYMPCPSHSSRFYHPKKLKETQQLPILSLRIASDIQVDVNNIKVFIVAVEMQRRVLFGAVVELQSISYCCP